MDFQEEMESKDLLVPLAKWGSRLCPTAVGTELVYSGISGGTKFNEEGGGANYLCMPTDPYVPPSIKISVAPVAIQGKKVSSLFLNIN